MEKIKNEKNIWTLSKIYIQRKVSGLFVNKDKEIYNDIVDDLRNKDFLSTNDYNKIHIKPVMKKVEIKEEKDQDDNFDIIM